jgi:hypothetical protein
MLIASTSAKEKKWVCRGDVMIHSLSQMTKMEDRECGPLVVFIDNWCYYHATMSDMEHGSNMGRAVSSTTMPSLHSTSEPSLSTWFSLICDQFSDPSPRPNGFQIYLYASLGLVPYCTSRSYLYHWWNQRQHIHMQGPVPKGLRRRRHPRQ